MAPPIILTVDDEIQVSNAIERDLRRYYRKAYRIVKATFCGSPVRLSPTAQRVNRRKENFMNG